MIQPNELRIGNLVGVTKPRYGERFLNIESITGESVNIDFRSYSLSELHPIPLTEEWLVKGGVVKVNTSSDKEGIFEYHHSDMMFMGRWCDGMFHWNGLDIKLPYLHQLQNLYFALTGQELPISIQ